MSRLWTALFLLCVYWNKSSNAVSIVETKTQLQLNLAQLNSITHGVSDQQLLTGSLGPRIYFQLIWTSFGTHETIIDQFIVKGVHQ